MATLRYPMGATTYDIQIDINGESQSPGITILPTDRVQFTNNARYDVDIEFVCENGPVFDDISDLAANGGVSSPQTPLTPANNQITTNYWIVNHDNPQQSHGPYSVEVAINPRNPAPLSITIKDGEPEDPDLDTAAVPQGGWVQFHYDQQYSLGWNPSSAFSGPVAPVNPLNPIYRASSGNQVVDATYMLTSLSGVIGSGTVKIHS